MALVRLYAASAILRKETIYSRLHISSNQLMNMRRWLDIVHPVEFLRSLTGIRTGNTLIPLLMRIRSIAIAIARQRLRQAVLILSRHQLHHETEDVVVDVAMKLNVWSAAKTELSHSWQPIRTRESEG